MEILQNNKVIITNEEEQQLFISWSGDTGKKIATLLLDWINDIYSNVDEKIFFSEDMEIGKLGLNNIMIALKKCSFGIFIITRERKNNPWIYFEAGAICKANGNNSIVPIYIDINRNELEHNPIINFQSKYIFTFESLRSLILLIGNRFGWKNTKHYGSDPQTVDAKFESKIKSICDSIQNDRIISELNKHNLLNSAETSYSGCIAHLTEDAFFKLRKIAVEEAEGELILAGPSLNEALCDDSQNNRSLKFALKSRIENKKITKIKIFLTDIGQFESEWLNSNEAIYRVSLSQESLFKNFFEICNRSKCEIDICFLSLINIDHAVITNKYMLFRPTKLWTSEGEFKGEYYLYKNNGERCEYNIHRRYLNRLLEMSTEIDLSIDAQIENNESYIKKGIKEWRKNIGRINLTKDDNGKLRYIRLHKLYYPQLIYHMARNWETPLPEMHFKKNGSEISNQSELFNARNLLNDRTQKYLLTYIKTTQELLQGVVKKYDSTDSSGAWIYPSLDLGFPNNSIRLAGGFATGMLITWKCGTPIVPVDATVNVCSSSVFELPDNYDIDKNDETFNEEITKLIIDASKNGYSFSFNNGNHFFMIATDENGKKYLVLHSSAKEFKDSYIGLYPQNNNWFSDKIRTYPSPYTSGRYMRYIKGNDAKFFIELAHKLEVVNEQTHLWFAEKLGGTKCNMMPKSTYHHYYMPTDSSIAIGTFVENPGTIVPIFSAPGKPICLYEIARKGNWTITLNGEEKCLVPHGWGQEIEDIDCIDVDHDKAVLQIKTFSQSASFDLSKSQRIDCNNKRIRGFDSCDKFIEQRSIIKGKIVKTLTPVFLYCETQIGKIK